MQNIDQAKVQEIFEMLDSLDYQFAKYLDHIPACVGNDRNTENIWTDKSNFKLSNIQEEIGAKLE